MVSSAIPPRAALPGHGAAASAGGAVSIKSSSISRAGWCHFFLWELISLSDFSHNNHFVEFLSVPPCGQFKLHHLFTECIKNHMISYL